jgi:hypothetical protein
MTRDYLRHGVTTLFAALSPTADHQELPDRSAVRGSGAANLLRAH